VDSRLGSGQSSVNPGARRFATGSTTRGVVVVDRDTRSDGEKGVGSAGADRAESERFTRLVQIVL
jgi:hypothetical protein